jgi:hypothetical protein
VLGRRFELEAGLGPLTGEGDAEELERLTHLAQGLFERDPVPAFDDAVRGGADAEHEAARGGV